jgi:hypothetical protein
MRKSVIVGLVFGLGSGVALAAVPALQIFAGRDFEPGLFAVTPAEGGEAQNVCVANPEMLVHAGLDAANGRDCLHTVVEDNGELATVAYSCRGLGSGRTMIVKDNRNHFTVDAQGIRGREPFALRVEYKRVGSCG